VRSIGQVQNFTGRNIEKVVINLAGEKHIDPGAETRIAMKRQ
jgi:hypothetical protein